MAPNTFGQIGTTPRTQMRAVAEHVHPKPLLLEALGARKARRDGVTPTVPREECALLRAQSPRRTAVHVGDHTAAKLNGIAQGDDLYTSRALCIRHVFTLWNRRPSVNSAFDQLT